MTLARMFFGGLIVLLVGCGGSKRPSPSPAAHAPTPTSPLAGAEPDEETESADEGDASVESLPNAGDGGVKAKRRQKAPCQPSLEACPESGCEEPGSPHALFNMVKRRTTTFDGKSITFDSAKTISFRTLKSLQKKADELVGQGKTLTEDERQKLISIKIGNQTFGEGSAVRLVGYLAAHSPDHPSSGVHPGGVESVNCRLDKPEWKDIHIPLIPKLEAEECAGVVVEMIPQGRQDRPSWTNSRLQTREHEKKRVLFVGPLFYDNEHRVRDDCGVANSQPKRMSLWEVHPVIEFYVCDDESACKSSGKAGWRRMD